MARYDGNKTVWQYAWAPVTHDLRVPTPLKATEYAGVVPPPMAPWFCNSEVDTRNPYNGSLNQYEQTHPPQELYGNPVYLKYMPSSYLELKSHCACSKSSSGPQVFGERYSTYPPCHPQHGFHTAGNGYMEDQQNHHQMIYKIARSSSHSVSVREDPADKELERIRHEGAPELRSQISTPQGQSSDFAYTASNNLQSERSPLQNQSLLKYMQRTENVSTKYTDKSVLQTTETEHTKTFTSVNSQEKGQGLGCEHPADDQAIKNFRNIMEEDESILMCRPTAPPGRLSNNESEAATACSKTPMSAVLRDVAVSTEAVKYMSASTQTNGQARFEKGMNTDVYMFDLDYLAGELMRLKMEQEDRDQREKMKRRECDVQHAQRVELCILALQYNMCRQHCWRLYSTCVELSPIHRDMSQYWPKEPPLNIVSALQKLDSDYNQMRDKILAGVPLERLAPLSVDIEKIIPETSYVPQFTTKQIIGEVLGNVPSRSSRQPNGKPCTVSGRTTATVPNTVGCQNGQEEKNAAHQHRETSSKSSRSLALIPQQPVLSACKSEEKQHKAGACKEQGLGEIWYDAAEDLKPAEVAVSADLLKESASEEAKRAVLCVSNLPSEVTESDVILLFEKYHVSGVSICTLKNSLRIAIVMFNRPEDADDAVATLNGSSLKDQTLHVERISRDSASISTPKDPVDSTKPQTNSASPGEKITSPLALSLGVNNNQTPQSPSAFRISPSPTVKGTCVPQHFGTMASLDILIPELTQLHPDVGRQRIVEALMELRARHRGALSRLPLGTVRQMTSDLLSRPANLSWS